MDEATLMGDGSQAVTDEDLRQDGDRPGDIWVEEEDLAGSALGGEVTEDLREEVNRMRTRYYTRAQLDAADKRAGAGFTK